MNIINGIDISHHQNIDSLKPAKQAGYQFVIIKATDGMRVDYKLEKHVNLALDAEMIPGFYHYMKANVPGHIEADFFLSTVHPYVQKFDNKVLYHHVDVEKYYVTVSKPEYSSELKIWLEYVDSVSWFSPGIYSSKWMWYLMTANAPWGFPYYGWLAQHTGVPYSLIPVGWDPSRINLQQWGVAGKHSWCPPSVPGIGACDLDRFFGTMAELKILANYGIPEPEPCPEFIPPPSIPATITLDIDDVTAVYTGNLNRDIMIFED